MMRMKVNKKTMRKKQMRKKKMTDPTEHEMANFTELSFKFLNWQIFNEMMKKTFVFGIFRKQDVERMLDREISDEQWDKFLAAENDTMHAEAHRIFENFICNYASSKLPVEGGE